MQAAKLIVQTAAAQHVSAQLDLAIVLNCIDWPVNVALYGADGAVRAVLGARLAEDVDGVDCVP